MNKKLISLLVAQSLMLGACSIVDVKPINAKVEKKAEEFLEKKALLDQGRPVVQKSTPAIEHVTDLWIPVKKIKSVDTDSRERPELRRTVAMNRSFTSLQDVAERITAVTGASGSPVPVFISPEALVQPTVTAAPGAAGASSGGLPTPGVSGATGLNQPINGINPNNTNIVYSGPLSGFLDVIASRYSVYWEWTDNGVRLYRTKTKTYRLAAIPGDTTLTSKITNSSGGSGGSAGGSGSSIQDTGITFTGLSVWKSVDDGIKTMLTTSGKVVVTPATGTVTVTDTPQVIAQVDKFIEQQNSALTRQVVVNVKVFSVELTNNDSYGINWSAVYSSLSGIYGFDLKSAFTPEVNSTTGTLKILSTAGSATSSSVAAWAGSNAMIDALSRQGRILGVTSATATTLNNQPAPLQVGRQVSYLASSTTTLGGVGVQPTTTLQPGVVNTGFSMNLIPHLLGDDKLLLQYAVDLSSIVDIKSVNSGTATIQTPEIETRNFLQRVSINSGDTLVVSGFEQMNESANQQGVGKADNYALGGGVKAAKSKSVLVILIQPVIVGK